MRSIILVCFSPIQDAKVEEQIEKLGLQNYFFYNKVRTPLNGL